MIRRSMTLLGLTLLALSGCNRASDPGKLTVAVIPKGTTHAFWQSIHAGAEKAAQELGVTAIWRGPLREDERSALAAARERGVPVLAARAGRRFSLGGLRIRVLWPEGPVPPTDNPNDSVTEAGVAHLKGLPQLRQVKVVSRKVKPITSWAPGVGRASAGK